MLSQKNESVFKLIDENPKNPGKNPPNLLLGGVKIKIQSLKPTKGSTLGSEGRDIKKKEHRLDSSEMNSSQRMVNALLENDRKVMSQIKVAMSEK